MREREREKGEGAPVYGTTSRGGHGGVAVASGMTRTWRTAPDGRGRGEQWERKADLRSPQNRERYPRHV